MLKIKDKNEILKARKEKQPYLQRDAKDKHINFSSEREGEWCGGD